MKLTCTRRLQFCAGHRVVGHENKCANLHGHNWVAYITAEAEQLDEIGRIVDFSVLKARYGDWIDRHWDHGMILFIGDPWLRAIRDTPLETKVYEVDFNPTSENLAECLLQMGSTLMDGTAVKITKVVLFETENCSSEATA